MRAADPRGAGIVDKDVELAFALGDLARQRLAAGPGGKVGGERNAAAVRRDFVGDEVVRLYVRGLAAKRVAVLESGGHEIDQEVQALYAGAGVMRAPGAAALLVSLASRRLQPAAVGL